MVRPPIKPDGSSVFNNGNKIPVKFKLSTAPSAFTFASVYSNNFPEGGEGEHDDDFAFLTFAPSESLTFNQITNLTANYEFTTGNCQGGSLRWQVTFDIGNDDNTVPEEGEPDPTANDRSLFIYYGDYPNFTNCTSEANDQSGTNMIGLSDLRYDTSQLGGTFYDTYANAQNLVDGDSETAALNVVSLTLALDSGWMQSAPDVYLDQIVDLASAQVNGNQFVPVTGVPTTTCDLPPALINVVEDVNGTVDDPANAQRKFFDTLFRETSSCTYTYNLDSRSLFGPGNYAVFLVIGGNAVQSPARFELQ